jgi:hypothetical protein
MQVEVYCDESRPELFVRSAADKNPAKTLIGSVWLPAEQRATYKQAISTLRQTHDVWGEVKWTKVSPSRLDFYLALVDFFFESDVRFRCIVVDSAKLDLKTFHQADSELGFYKFYYQLLHQWILPDSTYNIFCDSKVNRDRTRLTTLGQVLRNAKAQSTVENIQAVSSAESVLVQLCDLLLGAVQSRMNSSNRGSSAKEALVAHIEAKIGHQIGPTWPSEQKFNVFQIHLNETTQ